MRDPFSVFMGTISRDAIYVAARNNQIYLSKKSFAYEESEDDGELRFHSILLPVAFQIIINKCMPLLSPTGTYATAVKMHTLGYQQSQQPCLRKSFFSLTGDSLCQLVTKLSKYNSRSFFLSFPSQPNTNRPLNMVIPKFYFPHSGYIG